MGIRESWINLLHRAATGTKKTRTLLTPIGVAIFGGFTALFVLARCGWTRCSGCRAYLLMEHGCRWRFR